MTYIAPSRRGQCSGCQKTIQLTRTSAETPFCLDCRRAGKARLNHGSSGYRHGCRCDKCKRGQAAMTRTYRAKRSAQGRPLHKSGPERPCGECGSLFRARAERKFCSVECAVRAQGGELGSGKSDGRPRRYMSDADREVLYAAAGWCCALCGDVMRPDVGYLHDLYPTLDHIVPRSRGGSDDPSNLQPAHRICNLRKGARDGSAGRSELVA